MSTQRGRIQINGFDTEAVRERDLATDTSIEAEDYKVQSRWARAWRRFKQNRSAMIGAGIVLFMALVAFFAQPIESTVSSVVIALSLVGIAGVLAALQVRKGDPQRLRQALFGLLGVVGLLAALRFFTGITGPSFTVQPIGLAPHDPEQLLWIKNPDKFEKDMAPFEAGLAYPFGTDQQARDMFSRVIAGSRWSVSIGFVVVSISATIGIIYGGISGYYGGLVDEVMMRFVDIIFAFPALLLALVIVFQLGGGYFQLVAAFVIPGWAGYARLIRGEVLKTKEMEYTNAARALGARDRSVIFRHIVPNSITPVIVQASLGIGTVVIGVAALGFLGIGFESGTPEWGHMLNATRESLIQGPGATLHWWQTFFPGAAIFTFVMSMNLVGDGLNDALDAQEDVSATVGGGG